MTIAQQVARVSSSMETSSRAREFCLLARAVAARIDPMVERRAVAISTKIKTILEHDQVLTMTPLAVEAQRAAILAGTTTDTTWAAPLAEYQTIANAFLESLKNFGVFDRMLE